MLAGPRRFLLQQNKHECPPLLHLQGMLSRVVHAAHGHPLLCDLLAQHLRLVLQVRLQLLLVRDLQTGQRGRRTWVLRRARGEKNCVPGCNGRAAFNKEHLQALEGLQGHDLRGQCG